MRIFNGSPEVAITKDDLILALEEWCETRLNLRGYTQRTFTVSNIRHCRSDSTYSLRFNVEED